MEVRKSSHGVYRIEYHFVWIPHFRYSVLKKEDIKQRLRQLISEARSYHPEWQTEELEIESDHVHWLMSAPPKYSPSKIMQLVKTNTSRKLMSEFRFLRERYRWGAKLWSRGFFVSTVGTGEQTIKNYIKWQKKDDIKQYKLNL